MLQKTLIGLDLDNHSDELCSAHKLRGKKVQRTHQILNKSAFNINLNPVYEVNSRGLHLELRDTSIFSM